MCDPTAIAITQFAITAAGAAASYSSQQQAANDQNDYFQRNAQASNRAAAQRYNDIAFRQNLAQEKASNEKQKLQDQAIRARSKATVAAGEAGVQGLSVDALIGDFYGQEGRAENTIQQNLVADKQYLAGEAEATKSQAEGRINSVRQARGPDFSTAAVRVLGGGVEAFSSYRNNT